MDGIKRSHSAAPAQILLALMLGGCHAAAIAGEAMDEAAPSRPPTEAAETAPSEAPTAFPATVPEGVPSLQMSRDFDAPVLAIGMYQPVGQIVSRGYRLDPLTLRAWLHAGIGYDDNVGLSSTNKISSMLFTLNPSFSAGLEGRFHRYFAVYRGSYARYSSVSGSNYENHNMSLVAHDEWGARLRTSFLYDYLRGQDPQGSTVTATAAPQLWSIHTVLGTVSYGASEAKAGVSASLGYQKRNYHDQAVADPRDYERTNASVGFTYRVAPKTNATVSIGRAGVTHNADPTLDSTDMSYSLGMRWEATAKLSAAARVGYTTKDFAIAAQPDTSSPTYEVTVGWTPRTYSALSLTLRRTLAEAIELGSNSVVDTSGNVTWQHQWSDRIRSRVSAGYVQQKHERIARTDKLRNFTTGGSFRVERWLSLGAEYRRESRTSDLGGLDFDRNIVLFTVESAL